MRHRYTILFLFVLSIYTIPLSSQETVTEAEAVFTTVENRIVDNLSASQPHNLPIGIKRTIGNIPVTLALTSVKFGQQYGEASLLLKMQIPQKSQSLLFGATGVKMSFSGDLVDATKLYLLKDVPIGMGNLGKIVLKGNFDNTTGQMQSDTYVILDCNGDVKEISIDGEVILNPNTFRLCKTEANNEAPKDSIVTGKFRTSLMDWNDLLVETSFPKFEIKGAAGVEIEVHNAVLDMSDTRNSSLFRFIDGYKESEYYTLGEENLWRGLYVNQFSLTLPRSFDNQQTKERTRLQGYGLMIDENGISQNVRGENILPLEAGSADGWSFSVSDFRLSLLANNIKGFGFGGNILIPIGADPQLRPYEAYISGNEYLFNVALGEEVDGQLFGPAKIHLEPTSFVQIKVIDDQFVPTLSMDGYMALDSDLLKMEQITFRRLAISTRAPYLTVESMGYGGTVGLNGFPITISDIRGKATDDLMELKFDAKLNLMEAAKISASTTVTVSSVYKDRSWDFKGVSVDRIRLDNVELAGFSMDGEIRLTKNDPVYGDGFGGQLTARFNAFSEDLRIDVNAIFGSNDFRYWYVEGTGEFSSGIPVGGGVFIDGFTGGAYYRMKSTGKEGLAAYIPDEKSGLGIKAGASLYITKKNVINGAALLEMNFLQTGGIQNIRFFAQANFLEAASGTKTTDIFSDMRKNASGMGQSLANNQPEGQNGSDLSKSVINQFAGSLSKSKSEDGIKAYATLSYDFPSKTFDANFKTTVNVAGGLMRGSGAGNEAGSAHLHISPETWFVKAGTPKNPIGLSIGLGAISLKTSSYLMFGDINEVPQAPPAALLSKFGTISDSDDFMNFPQDLETGRGVAFGSRMSFDTGDLSFLILYARFQAGTGFDIMLRDMTGYTCLGSNNQIGTNNWYAMGQCYAYLQGKLGVRVKLLFIKKNITIISGGAAALLQAKLPNPTWIGGRLAVNLNILGIIKGNMDMKMSFGDNCEIVRMDGQELPLDFPIISDLSPSDNASDVDVFTTPQATLCRSLKENISVEDDNGKQQTFRVRLEDFYVSDKAGNKIDGQLKWNNNYDAVTFESRDILPPNTDLKAYISVNFEEYQSGSWVVYQSDGQPAREERAISFRTGEAPDHIPLHNIGHMYPVIGQKNMYPQETNKGYVQLKRGQAYLFPQGFDYNASFTANSNSVSSSFSYDAGDLTLRYNLPALTNNQNYDISFTAASNSQTSQQGSVTSSRAVQMQDGSDENFTISYEQKIAEQIVKDGGLTILEFNLKTSSYNTLAEKMSSIGFSQPDMRYVNEDVRSLLLRTTSSYELFDELELVGSQYTANKPLVDMEAIPTDNYYTKDVAPLIYDNYPLPNISITKEEYLTYGVPPLKALTLYGNYLNTVASNSYNATVWQTFPYVYDLPIYYFRHFYDMQTKAINQVYKANGDEQLYNALYPLIQGRFLFMRQGEYKTKIRYVLPDNTNGSSFDLNYINTLDWRQ